MYLSEYFTIMRRRWATIVIAIVACSGFATISNFLATPQYESSARLFVSTSETDDGGQLYQGGQFSAQRVKSYADLITSRELAQRVITDLELGVQPETLSGQVSAQAIVETVNLEISVQSTDPHSAQQIAQSYATELRDLVRELETPAGEVQAPIRATIVDAASYSDSPVSPRLSRNIFLGSLAGLILGLGLAIARHLLDVRVTSLDDVSKITDAPTLGTIINDPAATKAPLVTQIAPHAPRAESFRVLRTNLQFVEVDRAKKVFTVTSAVPAEGKTSTALNLALSLAQGGTKTLLIECDLRRPHATDRLGLDRSTGVTSVLVGKVKIEDAVQHHESGLDFIASGPIPPNPAELLQSKAMSEMLGAMRSAYDVVILDAPPLLPVTDAALLAAKSDGALMVVSHGKVTRDQLRIAIERLAQVDADLVGLVLNRVPAKGQPSYGYGYGYGPPAVEEEPVSGRRKARS